MPYGYAEAAGAIYVIARELGFHDVADAAFEALSEEVDENYGRALDEEKLGVNRVAFLIESAIEDSTPSVERAISALTYELQRFRAEQAKIASQRDALRRSGGAA